MVRIAGPWAQLGGGRRPTAAARHGTAGLPGSGVAGRAACFNFLFRDSNRRRGVEETICGGVGQDE